MEFLDGFFGMWASLGLPSWGAIGRVIGLWSVLMMAVIVLVTGLFVLGEAWGALKRKFYPQPFIPNNTRRPPV